MTLDEGKARETIALIDAAKAALGCSEHDLAATVRAMKLRADRGEAALREIQRLKNAQTDADREQLICALSEAGKLPPAMHPWAETQSIESLEAFGRSAPRLVNPTEQHAEPRPTRRPEPPRARGWMMPDGCCSNDRRDLRSKLIAEGLLIPGDPARLREPRWCREAPFLALDDAGRESAARSIRGENNDQTIMLLQES